MRERHRGWRFSISRIDVPEAAEGLGWAPTGGIATVTDEDAVRQSLLLLLLTRPGERVMRPEYGCHLERVIFAPNDDTTAGLAIHYVRRAVERWEPRVEILAVDATRAPEDPTVLEVVLSYRVRASQRTGRLALPVRLDGEVPA